jgi:hypothetical protein
MLVVSFCENTIVDVHKNINIEGRNLIHMVFDFSVNEMKSMIVALPKNLFLSIISVNRLLNL